MTPTRHRQAERARTRFGVLADTYERSLTRGDPLADAYAARFEDLGPGRATRLLDRALAEGIDAVPDAPEELRALLAAVDATGHEVDWDQVEAGQRAMVRAIAGSAITLQAAALMADYWSEAFSKPLAFTGSLIDDTNHRLSQTASWWSRANIPGSMRPGAAGSKATVRVRVVHARARWMVAHHPDWDEGAWGTPINQGDLLFQALGFTWLSLRGMRQMGYRFSAAEIEGVYALWRRIGHVLGLDEELIELLDEATMTQLWDLWFLTNPPPDGDCRLLARATLDANLGTIPFQDRLGKPILSPVLAGLTREFLGGDVTDAIGLPGRRARWLLPTVVRPVVGLSNVVLKLDRGAYDRRVRKAVAGLEADLASKGFGDDDRIVSAPTRLRGAPDEVGAAE